MSAVLKAPVAPYADVPKREFTPGPANTEITIRGLTKHFAGWPLYENFDLDIPKGQNVTATYPIATVKASKAQDKAQAFMDLVLSAEGQQVLNLLVKADVQGSVEALRQALTALSNDQIRINVIGGGVGHMVQGPSLVVNVEVASENSPKTVDDAKKESEMYDGVKNLKDEKLADGWLITFDNVGGMGANYHVNSRREIDGKSITCNTMVSTAEQQSTAVNFCKSLKK